MAGTISIKTGQVEAIATELETINAKLHDTLLESQSTIKNLSSTWQGEAATATFDAYDVFANNYFNNYSDIIKAYITFLRQNVAADYVITENANIALAEAFK